MEDNLFGFGHAAVSVSPDTGRYNDGIRISLFIIGDDAPGQTFRASGIKLGDRDYVKTEIRLSPEATDALAVALIQHLKKAKGESVVDFIDNLVDNVTKRNEQSDLTTYLQ